MPRPDRLIHKRGSIEHETNAAYLADLDTESEPVWLPKSEVEYEDGEFIIPGWLAKEKGIDC